MIRLLDAALSVLYGAIKRLDAATSWLATVRNALVLRREASSGAGTVSQDEDEREWWTIAGSALQAALHRAHEGEDPEIVYAEMYANSERTEAP